jgi:S-adenosylmethionine synthetase
MAEKLCGEVKGVEEAYVKILSQIGKPITEPLMTHVQVVLDKGYSVGNISADIKSIVDEELANVSALTDVIIDGKVDLF